MEQLTPVYLFQSEVDEALKFFGYSSWESLDPSLQRQVARHILGKRTDVKSIEQLELLDTNMPTMNDFVVVSNPPKQPVFPVWAAALILVGVVYALQKSRS